jgi:hypothetical protein
MQQDISSMSGNREMLVRGTPGNASFKCGFNGNTVKTNRLQNNVAETGYFNANGRISC